MLKFVDKNMNVQLPNKNLAPIILFVFNRPQHTKKTIDALRKNKLAIESRLFIFSDGPRSKSDIKNVSEVRKFIKTIVGFKEINIVERKRNLGLAQSIINGVTEIVNRNGKVIVLEDDMISSPYFLKFMNDSLNYYQNSKKVISIQGYMYPIKNQLPETFFLRMADCWGWATWDRGWELFEPNGQLLLDQLKRRKLECNFDFNYSFGYTQMLKDQISGQVDSWAIRWYASIFLKNKLGLYPGRSLISNIGMDGTGQHSGSHEYLDTSIEMAPISISKITIEEDLYSRKQIENYFLFGKKNFSSRIKNKVQRLYLKLNAK